MIKKWYILWLKSVSREEERGERSGGYWQNQVREAALDFAGRNNGAGGPSGNAVLSEEKILEIGCGEGLFLARLAERLEQASIEGVDLWEDALERARQRLQDKGLESRVRVTKALGSGVPFEPEAFNTVVCVNLFFNLPDRQTVQQVIKEAARVLRPGGLLVCDIRNKRNPLLFLKYRLAPFYDETVRDLPLETYSLSELDEMLTNAGLVRESCRPVVFPRNALSPILVVAARKPGSGGVS